MKTFAKIVPILILSLLSSLVLLFQSCGDTAPFGSTITLEATSAVDTGATIKSQSFRVSVSGSDGKLMNGISVQIAGGKAGTNYGFNALPTPGVTSFTITTNDFGFNTFQVQGPLTIDRQLLPPTVTLTENATGSLISGNTYCYQVTADDPVPGSTPGSTEACITLSATGLGVNVIWSPVTHATSYDVYGRTFGAEGLIAAGATSPFVDDGTVVTPGALTPTTNTTTVYTGQNNTFTDTLRATSGAVSASLGITF